MARASLMSLLLELKYIGIQNPTAIRPLCTHLFGEKDVVIADWYRPEVSYYDGKEKDCRLWRKWLLRSGPSPAMLPSANLHTRYEDMQISGCKRLGCNIDKVLEWDLYILARLTPCLAAPANRLGAP